jgi:hypothetical protein
MLRDQVGTTQVKLVANSSELAEGGTIMAILALLDAVFAFTLEQFVQWRYGATGLVGLLFLTLGVKAKSPTCSSIGAVVLALTLTRPAI